ncbi:serine/threonine protein kinase [Mycobacterium sp. M1]|uniref:non-specific serine/threonine protein kinase n=1 Tax=Mycolicibacter acidiphilus TaxID=2835306 RepID=A0ABS5RDS4_9MYCO|nr:serine/threonine-protein kinase [Mycolicibacter acidiphilus]MBS9532438.1 serine/threonine protein kinase [Mycolicibacter acidiphilus]
MTLAADSVFAEYRIIKLLGAGAMGKVYLAQHPRLPRRDAVKVLRGSLSADEQYRERFQREARAAATLFHPNIVGVHDCGEYRRRLWLAMDYVDGQDLGRLLRKRFPAGMPVEAVLPIVSAVADALDYAHRQGIIHRDVKPGNILVTKSPDSEQRALLADFGIARQISDPSGLTATNLTIGTIAYAAPEQLTGSDGLSRADQYALAATTFDLLTGAPPFDDDNAVTVISRHLSEPPPRLSERRPELAHLDEVLATALAKNPSDRYSGCTEFAAALNACADGAGRSSSRRSTVTARVAAPPASAARHRVPAPAHRRATLRLVTGAVATTSALLGGAVLAQDRTDTPAVAKDAGPQEVSQSVAPTPPTSEPPAFTGVYRVDANRVGQLYNGVPNPQPPNVSTWWAVRSSCAGAACTAAGVMVDDTTHLTAMTDAAGAGRLSLDWVDRSWRSRPQTSPMPCVGSDGTHGVQTATQVLTLEPTISGVLHGAMVVTVETNECGQRGARIQVPVVATRAGDVAASVDIPRVS